MAEINLTPKQTLVWEYLFNDTHTDVLAGGSAGGSKTFTGCLWITTLCLKYDGIRCLIGRAVLAQLKQSTLNTLFEVMEMMGLKPTTHFTYNAHSNVLTFFNGSEIILKDLQYMPSDARYESLSGYELTAVFVDECTQITELCYQILKSRIRYKLNQYKLIPKILLTCNPANCWVKKMFYIPHTQGMLDPKKVFIQILPYDNPHLPPSYIEILKTLPTQERMRLLEGSWQYLDEPDALFDYDSITNCIFKLAPNANNRKYCSLDISRFGEDRTVIMIWVGLVLIECHILRKIDATGVADKVTELCEMHGIDRTSIIADSDGVGSGVTDILKAIGFVNNSKALHKQNFSNLKSQCYVTLSQMIKDGKISFNLTDSALMEEMAQELLAVKLKDLDRDNKIAVQSKDEMKRILGKSPDLSDALMMRMWFELKNLKSTGRYALQFTNYG
jgi:hypothetical protein